jgi:L-threonylcarbamoyladenylate synthase
VRRFDLAAVDQAGQVLRQGGVLGYPTEAVFGLGCDPGHEAAFARIFELKQRPAGMGVLLIAAEFAQLKPYIDLDAVPKQVLHEAQATWPGPHTWVFPRAKDVPPWVAGDHPGVALRVTAHEPAAALCRAFGGALVSTSANVHGQPPARSTAALLAMFEAGLDGVLDAPLGGLERPTPIRDALTGAIIRS